MKQLVVTLLCLLALPALAGGPTPQTVAGAQARAYYSTLQLGLETAPVTRRIWERIAFRQDDLRSITIPDGGQWVPATGALNGLVIQADGAILVYLDGRQVGRIVPQDSDAQRAEMSGPRAIQIDAWPQGWGRTTTIPAVIYPQVQTLEARLYPDPVTGELHDVSTGRPLVRGLEIRPEWWRAVLTPGTTTHTITPN